MGQIGEKEAAPFIAEPVPDSIPVPEIVPERQEEEVPA